MCHCILSTFVAPAKTHQPGQYATEFFREQLKASAAADASKKRGNSRSRSTSGDTARQQPMRQGDTSAVTTNSSALQNEIGVS